MQSKQYFTKIKNYPHEKSTEPFYHFYFWNDAMNEMRLVTSWDTTDEDIDSLIERIKSL